MGGGRSTHTDQLPSRLSHLYLYQRCCGHKILHLLCNKILHLRCSDPCVYSCSPRRRTRTQSPHSSGLLPGYDCIFC